MATADRITFCGAAGEVTGSCYLIESAGGGRILVDCGSHQGPDADKRNAEPFPFDAASIDAVLLTHAHIDHSGRLPLLVKRGFKGNIWTTDPTIELCSVLLSDTARLSAEDAQWKTRKNARRGLPPVEPLYGERDVENTLALLRYAGYDDRVEIAPGIKARFRDAGHIAGSAIIELWLGMSGDGPRPVKIVFSGDMGSNEAVIENPPSVVEDADYVVIESTYGDRNHKGLAETRAEFRAALEAALEAGGKILIPTFAVDRAQRLLYELLLLQGDKTFPKLPPIYFDSPMGMKATQVYERHLGLLSRELREQARGGQNPFAPDGLKYTSSPEESRAINEAGSAIVLAGSGMCSGGRIMHHLKHNLWNPNCRVIFVGYQARGTLGRRLVDGEKNVRVAGEDVTVGAKLHTLGGFSAHAGRDDLIGWARRFREGASFFVTHGEKKSSDALADALRDIGYHASVPALGTSCELVPRDGARAAAPVAIGAPRPSDAREDAFDLISQITEAAASIREAIERGADPAVAMPLLESTRLVLDAALKMGAPRD